MSLAEILNQLSKKDRDYLMLAFESDNCAVCEYQPGRFVAVNIDYCRNEKLHIEHQIGLWSYGTVTGDLPARE